MEQTLWPNLDSELVMGEFFWLRFQGSHLGRQLSHILSKVCQGGHGGAEGSILALEEVQLLPYAAQGGSSLLVQAELF